MAGNRGFISQSNCKIMIRGKGSVKEGKIGRKDGQPLPGEDEPLHALVSSTAVENVQKAVKEIQNIIKQVTPNMPASVPFLHVESCYVD